MKEPWAKAPSPATNISKTWNTLGLGSDGAVTWVEVCFCATPLAEERPYWEKYFELLSVKDAHARKNCRDLNGTEPWACCNCDCTSQLEERLAQNGEAFLGRLRSFRSQS
jgi:hypothetical protein